MSNQLKCFNALNFRKVFVFSLFEMWHVQHLHKPSDMRKVVFNSENINLLKIKVPVYSYYIKVVPYDGMFSFLLPELFRSFLVLILEKWWQNVTKVTDNDWFISHSAYFSFNHFYDSKSTDPGRNKLEISVCKICIFFVYWDKSCMSTWS